MNDDEVRETLTAKLAEIDAEMAEMEKPPTDQGTISFGKRIGEGTSMAIDRMAQVAVHDRMQVTRADVVRALEKLDEGTYGVCDVCGRPDRRGPARGAAVGRALRRGRRQALTRCHSSTASPRRRTRQTRTCSSTRSSPGWGSRA